MSSPLLTKDLLSIWKSFFLITMLCFYVYTLPHVLHRFPNPELFMRLYKFFSKWFVGCFLNSAFIQFLRSANLSQFHPKFQIKLQISLMNDIVSLVPLRQNQIVLILLSQLKNPTSSCVFIFCSSVGTTLFHANFPFGSGLLIAQP